MCNNNRENSKVYYYCFFFVHIIVYVAKSLKFELQRLDLLDNFFLLPLTHSMVTGKTTSTTNIFGWFYKNLKDRALKLLRQIKKKILFFACRSFCSIRLYIDIFVYKENKTRKKQGELNVYMMLISNRSKKKKE